MNDTKRMIRKSFWWMLLWCACLGAGLYAALFQLSLRLEDDLFVKLGSIGKMDPSAMSKVSSLLMDYRMVLAAAVAAAMVLLIVACWLTLRLCFRASKAGAQPGAASGKKTEKPGTGVAEKSAKEKKMDDQRLALHLFTILQREGRLMDFFAETLDAYEDAQIGAAARGVHESCKKVLEKHLKPAPVMSQAEGENIVVPAGFDPASIKLTGNVSGQPPFQGIVRHRGWRAARYDMPSLATQSDPGLIAPAEVEIT